MYSRPPSGLTAGYSRKLGETAVKMHVRQYANGMSTVLELGPALAILHLGEVDCEAYHP